MTDKELLRLAAMAAGYPFLYFYEHTGVATVEIDGKQTDWNPLIDDGDALRLSIDLDIAIPMIQAAAGISWDKPDRYAATRRAIVRAAAAIAAQEKPL